MNITTPAKLAELLKLLQSANLITNVQYNAMRRSIWADTNKGDGNIDSFCAYLAKRESFKPNGRHLKLCAKVEALCNLFSIW